LALGFVAQAQEEGGGRREAETVDRAARRLYEQALDYIAVKQYERGLTMLDNVILDNSGTILAYRAHMAKGNHYLEQNKTENALTHFMLLSRLLAPAPGKEQSEEEQELFKQSLFNTGLAYYKAGKYGSSFPAFRRLTETAGGTKWANQAYFYIGMSHYNLKNWNKAIDALNLVGTEIEESGDAVGRIEIGQRFYAKIVDDDIPVIRRFGKPVSARVKVASGDVELLNGVAMAGKKNAMMVSAPTQVGAAKPNDGVLQIVGGDTLACEYIDASTESGKKNVPRYSKVKAVSTGTIGFYLGDLNTPAYLAYPGQPQVVLLRDADLDTDNQPQKVRVRVKVVYKEVEKTLEEDAGMLDILAVADQETTVWRERDSIDVVLTEQNLGTNSSDVVRSGVFVGRVKLTSLDGDSKPNPNDDVLNCDEADELEVTYTDKVHIYGDELRENVAKIKISGKVHSGIDISQYDISDAEAVLRARKYSVEAEALKGLAEIYNDMGLVEQGAERADKALEKVNTMLKDREKLSKDLVENAFRIKWECEFLKNDFDAATATCRAFSRLYPESVLADQALMTLSRTLVERGNFAEALKTYQTVLSLQNPISAAEAQYRIGELYERQAAARALTLKGGGSSKWDGSGKADQSLKDQQMGPAMQAYSQTFEKYPESPYAAKAIEKVARHYSSSSDYARAITLFEKVASDYPDAEYMDDILFAWGTMGLRMENKELAKEKLTQLVYNYPASKHASEARRILGAL
jgi:TolA-binding protein